ncbi:hypothetical protein Shyhy02_74200 [Streptomyces hygroscopicus subsp. hygroscopicus]|nr:hypothetical protein Shyhy02_74200 [Streptomyces hygroscopicus subsp. hygroscopicus]
MAAGSAHGRGRFSGLAALSRQRFPKPPHEGHFAIASERTAERVRVSLARLRKCAEVPEVATLLAEHQAAWKRGGGYAA